MEHNPMLLNLMRAQQQGGGGFTSPFAPPQGMPMPMDQQQMPPEMMQQPMEQPAPTSPFDVGISRAVQSSRAALQMAPDQEGRALRRAMLGFGESIGSQHKVRGFLNNLGQGLKALGPGVAAHDEAEAAAQMENQAMAEKLIAHQMAKRDYEDRMQQRAMDNEFRERAFGEQKRYHDMYAKAKSGSDSDSVEINGQSFAKLNKTDLTKAKKARTLISNNMVALKDINKAYTDLNELTKDNTFDAVGGWSKVANAVKDTEGRLLGVPALKKETAARKNLEAQLGKLNTALEAVKAGGGKLGIGMYDRLKPFFPDPKEDDKETFEAKLKQISDETELYFKAADASTKYGAQIDPYDIQEAEEATNEAVQEAEGGLSGSQLSVRNFRIPNGEIIPVPANRIDLIQKWLNAPGAEEVQ